MVRPCIRLFLTILAGKLALAACAHGAVVETLDGQVARGRIRLENPGHLAVIPSAGGAVSISLTNLLRAEFVAPTNLPSTQSAFARSPRHVQDERKGELPPAWRGADIGQTSKPGGASHYHGTFTLAAHPRTRKGKGDTLHYVWQSWRGDGEIVARVASLRPRDEKQKQARAGVMMRASLEPEASCVSMALSGGLGSLFKRTSRKGDRVMDDKRPDLKAPYWVRLTREGGTITGYQSADGKDWKLLGSSETDLPSTMLAGLAVWSRRGEPAEASLDHVAIRSSVPRSEFTPRIVLKDGTVIADHLVAMDDSGLVFSKERSGLKVRLANVARLLFQPVFQANSLTPGRTGLLMSNGDFVDGEVRAIKDDKVTLDSVLLGRRVYDLNRKVAAVVLRDQATAPAMFEVTTHDGSVWRTGTLSTDGDAIRVEAPLAGQAKIAIQELVEIRRIDRKLPEGLNSTAAHQ
jgi:hypothetical protein